MGASGSRSITTFEGAIYVATTPTGVRKSVDDGATWTLANTGLPAVGANINVQSIGHSGSALLCGTQSGVYRSTDNGANWTNINGPLPTATPAIYCNKIYHFNNLAGSPTIIVFTGQIANNGGGVFRTFDNGTTWLAGFSGLSSNMEVYNIDEFGGVLYASTNTALMRSSDQGASWQQVGNTNWTIRSVQGAYGRLVILGALGAQYSTNNGATWQTATGYGSPNITACPAGSELIAYDGKFFAITKQTDNGVYRSLNNGQSWEPFNTGFTPQNQFAQEEFHATSDHLYISCLFDSYRTAGTSTGLDETVNVDPPVPYPTSFAAYFNLDLTEVPGDRSVVLIDASGREAVRHPVKGGGLTQVHRGNLVAGRYHCMLVDPNTGLMRSLGMVFAE